MASTPKDGERCAAYGFKFTWTPDHLTPEQMRPYMFSYDVLATEALDVLDHADPDPVKGNISAAKQDRQAQTQGQDQQTSQSGNPDNNKPKSSHHKRDLFTLLQTHHHENETLSSLWSQIHTIPEWVDWAQIARGQLVFYRYALPFVISLTFQSLLGGMGSSRVSHTLSKTGGFSGKITRKRLLDTFQHVLDVTRDLDSIKPGPHNGKGFVSSVKVRLLHASVRRRILLLAKEDASYYNVESNGIPINDLDSMATIIAFSATVVFLGFPRQGIFLRRQEIQDYLALWRWVGYLMGTPVDEQHFSSPEKAKALMESLGLYEIDPSPTSAALANNIITGLQNQPPTFASRDFLQAQAHWLNGRELATALKIPKPGLYYFVLVGLQCALFMGFAYVRRAVPCLDERNICRMRRLLRKEAVMNQCRGVEASHGFKYLPRLGKDTVQVQDGPPSEEEEVRDLFGAAGGRKKKRRGFGEMDWSFGNDHDHGGGAAERFWLVVVLGVSAALGGVGLWLGRGLVVGV
ncbi:hypothetical protein QBC37DRAFT_283763 [Rhypophila decipiens]|uniref:ER-bound oxygenase mpaB/mpaB'/Rubber oxygenase catalytic domain-containing protein n=1 Tax=Rhypophila decipiens TaxID=261697 RepID=A0AAN7B890_9PEZI|nr:hypothetical protein QBC37DRAFT_283763 [Rhypophila decipiens]